MKSDTIQSRLLSLRGDMSQQDLAMELEQIRNIYYPDLKTITRNDVANWESSEKAENKRTSLKASDVHLLSLFFGEDCDYIITGRRAANKTISADLNLSESAISALKIEELGQDISFLCDNGEERIIHYLTEIIKASIVLQKISNREKEAVKKDIFEYLEVVPGLAKESGINNFSTTEQEKWFLFRQLERIIEKAIERIIQKEGE